MARVLRTATAARDVARILEDFADFDPSIARRCSDDFGAKAEMLGRFPEIGRPRPELGPGRRSLRAADQYLIIYRIVGDDVLILRVLHARMDILRMIRDDPGE